MIDSPEKLEKWLNGKPPRWAAVIALRCALRVVPVALDPALWIGTSPQARLTKALFRACSISTSAACYPTAQIAAAAANAAARAANAAKAAARAAANAAANAAADAAYAAADAAYAAANAAYAAAVAANAAYAAALWRAVDADTRLLTEGMAPEQLARTALWPEGLPDSLAKSLEGMRAFLTSNTTFALWATWYQRRLDGKASLFDLPPPQDEELAQRLVAQNDRWWEGEPAEVNAEIQGWIDELRPPISFEQNPRVPAFTQSGEQLGLSHTGHGGEVGKDAASVRRHAALREALQKALEASHRDLTQAVEIGVTINEVAEYLGTSPESCQPENFILYSKALRREMTEHLSPTSSKPPLSEGQIKALEVVMDADAIYAPLDDYLGELEQAIYDRRFGSVSAERGLLLDMLQAAKDANLPDDEAEDVLKTAVENVAEGASPENPDRKIAGQTFANLLRKLGQIAAAGIKVSKNVAGFGGWVAERAEGLKEQFPNLGSVIDVIKDIFGKGS